ncbi:hypothetical protein VTN77DRAFT_2639 [Rasamsonia byssochlamydoides]|uniref:uncharacterized protein n=1 Tax=Rasamsonia byssochlamydoides TaxID=89139 RepID=UPI0037424F0C
MNTIRSTWIGWGALCVAGGGAYYFAKKSVNADRAARYEADMRRKAQLAAAEAEHRRAQAASSSTPSTPSQTQKPSDLPSLQRANAASGSVTRDDVASPSTEAGQDPAPTRHEPETEKEKLLEKSKYEAAETFRPPRGNRFS